MFTLTSNVTKVAVFALSAGMAWSTFNAVTLGFQAPLQITQVIELPPVVVIGYRISVSPYTMQATAKVTAPSRI